MHMTWLAASVVVGSVVGVATSALLRLRRSAPRRYRVLLSPNCTHCHALDAFIDDTFPPHTRDRLFERVCVGDSFRGYRRATPQELRLARGGVPTTILPNGRGTVVGNWSMSPDWPRQLKINGFL